MLYDFFCSYLYIIEDPKIPTCIIYANTSTSTHSDLIYKSEGSSNNDGGKGGTGNNDGTDNNDGANQEEESFELEEELAHIERVINESNNAMILDEKLPDSEKGKNSHLNNLRNDSHVKDFFEGKTFNVTNLPLLNDALVQARKDRKEELSEAKNYANYESSNNSLRDQSNDQSSNNSLRDQSNSSLHESLNKKEDNHNYSGYKLLPSLLDSIIEILNNILG